jgi:membrane associated rhomboid family serine protease
MRPLALHRGSVYLFGSRFPAAVIILFVATLVATLVGVVGYRNGFPLLDHVGLSPRAVGQGQVWRLVTWVFFDPSVSPLSLLFFGMMLLMFGRDLCDAWGWRRFTAVYLGIAVAAGVLTCLVALAWRALMLANYMDTWPVIDALVVAWALSFPTRQILFNFVIPLSGRALVWITVGLTLFFAVLSGLAGFVPHLAALAAIFAWLRGVPLLRRQWLGSRLRRAQGPSRTRRAHLRAVDEPDEKPRWYH